MHKSFLLLSLAAAGWIAGCGSGGGSSSTTTSVRVSDGYVVGATVTAGDTTASEALKKGAGWYQFGSVPQESISVQNGVNDIVTENGIANAGEPYAPLMYAPASYTNITPFTSLLDILGATAMAERYPNAYAYNSTFDFDVVATGKKNFEIAKESAKAALELSALQQPSGAPQVRIINGSIVSSSDTTWRFIVALEDSYGQFCGGSLIAPDWVLTAGHCVTNSRGGVINYLPTVYYGSYSLVEGGNRVSVSEIFRHPNYDDSTIDNDIALLHLSNSVTTITPIALNTALPSDGTMTEVAGWGNLLTVGQDYPDDLYDVGLPVINFNTCKNSYASDGTSLTTNMFCAGYMSGLKDSCQGDSGGPLIVNKNGTNYLSGVVSFGGTASQWCGAPGFPGVYTRVNNYIDWIEGHTGDLGSSSSSSGSSTSLETMLANIDAVDSGDYDTLNTLSIEYLGAYNGYFEE